MHCTLHMRKTSKEVCQHECEVTQLPQKSALIGDCLHQHASNNTTTCFTKVSWTVSTYTKGTKDSLFNDIIKRWCLTSEPHFSKSSFSQVKRRRRSCSRERRSFITSRRTQALCHRECHSIDPEDAPYVIKELGPQTALRQSLSDDAATLKWWRVKPLGKRKANTDSFMN